MNYLRSASLSVSVTIFDENGEYVSDLWLHDVAASYDVEDGKIYVDSEEYRKLTAASAYATSVNLLATYYKYDYNYSSSSQAISFEKNFVSSDITKEKPYHPEYSSYYSSDKLILSDELVCEIAEAVLEDSYCQVSLFFENDRLAAEAAKKLSDKGFIAVTSNTTYEPDPFTVILETIAALFLGFFWILNIVFVAFFINLTSSRVLMAFRSDMAIMRSMGIQVKVIKIGMYVRMLISLIPAFLSVILLAILLFTSPLFNAMFSFLYIWEYFVIFFGMILLSVRITKKQISKLFGESVKKSLKGGSH